MQYRIIELPNYQITEYRLTTVAFGTKSAPYLVTRVLQQLAEEEKSNFSTAAEITKRHFYVDDLLTGAESAEEAFNLKNQLQELMTPGGFQLRKWASSDERVLKLLLLLQLPPLPLAGYACF